MKRKLLRCMTAVATMLFATSCTSELALEGVPQSGVDGEEVEVTFSVSAQSANAAMRAATDEDPIKGPGQWQDHIGRAENIDMLIYAVYEYDENAEKYVLLTQYGSSDIPSELSSSKALSMQNGEGKIYEHEGQTILAVDESFRKGTPKEITLRLMRNKTYHIAFWAQSSNTTAFVTDNLEQVEVLYANAENNDELRDAFCKVETFSVSANANSRTVVLTRPMAQINVGTTGADYTRVVEVKKRTYTKTQISLKGVAKFLNVVTNEIDEKKENLVSVDYTMSNIPALLYNNHEEYLRIDLDNDGKIKKYSTKYPTVNKDDQGKITEFLTEEFKYLSMCYVLVPAAQTNKPNYDTDTDEPDSDYSSDKEEYQSSTLGEVSVTWFDVTTNPEKTLSAGISLTQVPVHRNWRTNILCGLYDKDPNDSDPNDPDPDDPTSIYTYPIVEVILDANYDGEYNKDGNSDWTQGDYTGPKY